MATVGPRAVISPPPLVPPRYGLLTSATVNEAEGRTELGVTWVPEPCAKDGELQDPCGTFTFSKGDAIAAPGTYDDLIVAAGQRCTSQELNNPAVDVQQRAQRSLLAQQSLEIEKEWWTGTKSAAIGNANRYLAKDADVTKPFGTTATKPIHALAELEEGIATCRVGSRALIHATLRTVSYWMHFGLLRREGNLLLTALDTIVVPGAGYPGTSPTGAAPPDTTTSWAYATGPVEVYLGPIQFAESKVGFTVSSGQSIPVDEHLVVAWRTFAVESDTCCIVGVNVENESQNE